MLQYLKNVTTIQYEPERCTGCKRCLEVCPHEVFTFAQDKAVLHNKDACMECGACMMNCAFGAIEVNAGVGCAAAVIYGKLKGIDPSCDCSGDLGSTGCC